MNEANHLNSDTWNEIVSQPEVWQVVLQDLRQSRITAHVLETCGSAKSWLFVGCGTSYYLAEAAAASWTLLTGEPARALPASEVQLYPELIHEAAAGPGAIVISRSGRTSEAVRAASVLKQDLHVRTIGITCADQSALQAECDDTLILNAADEKSTVMTRSFTSMLIGLQYLAARHAINDGFVHALEQLAHLFSSKIASTATALESFVARHSSFADYVFLGQGPLHGIAREAALKVMEMSCSYSQPFHTLEFRHGPKAIVSPRTCLMFFMGQHSKDTETAVLQEMKDLGGVTITVCDQATDAIRAASDLLVETNIAANELTLLAPFAVSGQLLGFFTGVDKGLNPDQPKNLTRVVMLD